jgi:hypothetical protein
LFYEREKLAFQSEENKNAEARSAGICFHLASLQGITDGNPALSAEISFFKKPPFNYF